MAKSLINKYVWLVETIYKAGYISFEEINRRWSESELSEGVDLPLRTFHKWRITIEEMFGLIIDCKRKGGYHYYIVNAEELKGGTIRNWLLNTISVSNLIAGNQQMKDRILLENIPSGQEYLSDIIEAMKTGCCINITYQGFMRTESKTFKVEPYCVKLFKQRWYLTARNPYYNKIVIYSLDRIKGMRIIKEEKFVMPSSFVPSEYFEECFGVIANDGTTVEDVVLKASAEKSNYLRSLPFHNSQQEIQVTDEYSIFTLRIRPTYDFLQEILRHGYDIEILQPIWFREQVINKINKMSQKYKK